VTEFPEWSHPPTIKKALRDAERALQATSESSRLDTEALLCHSLQCNRSYLYTWPEKRLTQSQSDTFLHTVERRTAGEPIAYITGEREFWSRVFTVNRHTLIPRPETELLVELALQTVQQQFSNVPLPQILDLGTGSGCIAISLAAEDTNLRVDASDISEEALATARANAERHQATVNFIQSNWFSNIDNCGYHIIISNPPYIAADDHHLRRDGLTFEPSSALVAGNDGMADLLRLIEQSPDHLQQNGLLLLEHGMTQAAAVSQVMTNRGFINVQTHRDLAHRDRVTSAAWPGDSVDQNF